MQISRAGRFADVYILTPPVYRDERGFFMESFRASWLNDIAPDVQFVQDNHSFSHAGVLRGLHYQLQQPQGKLVRVMRGRILDVVVDMRVASPTFGQWESVELSAANRRQLWIPPGYAHGFYTLEDADCLYRCSDYYHAVSERVLRWDDPQLGIQWPVEQPLVSAKDQQGVAFAEADYFTDSGLL